MENSTPIPAYRGFPPMKPPSPHPSSRLRRMHDGWPKPTVLSTGGRPRPLLKWSSAPILLRTPPGKPSSAPWLTCAGRCLDHRRPALPGLSPATTHSPLRLSHPQSPRAPGICSHAQQRILDRFSSSQPAPRKPSARRLLALPGVGPETADAILLYALDHPVPVADEYLRRIVERHGHLPPQPGRERL